MPSFQAPWRQSTDKEEYYGLASEETIPLDDEHHSPADEIAGLRRTLHTLRLWLIGIGVVAALALLIGAGARYSHKLPVSLQWTKSPIPDIPIVPKTLNQDNRYAVISSPESDHIWHSLIPSPGTGFVTIQDARKYPHLQPGMPGDKPNEEVYGVSLFHQLHCVIHIRHHMWALEKAAKTHDDAAVQSMAKANGHINHCFDFIRQALMCNADLTLEWPESAKDKDGTGRVDGNHIPHQCKNWGTIFDWASRNAYAQDGPV
ncbi:hypothetical protein LTR53_001239 [Teratosphaeriaceae sp. CCFEE 6253]|nr:hypothetical protein LTR53_001239 [Teratosphaeriaceae sp. CCFEE 6253]